MSVDPRGALNSDPSSNENLAAPAGRPPSGDISALQLGMPTFPPAPFLSNIAPPISTGGILGGHPSVGAGGEAAARPNGILGNLFDSSQLGPEHEPGWPYAPFNLQRDNPLGNYPLPISDLLFGRLGTSSPLSIPSHSSAVAPPGTSQGGEGTSAQLPWEPQVGADSEWQQMQNSSSGISWSSAAGPLSSQLRHPFDSTSSEHGGTPSENNDDPHVYAHIYHPEGSATRANDGVAEPSQSTDRESNWPALLQRVGNFVLSEPTGDPRIDKITEALLKVIAETNAKMGFIPPEMRPSVFGTFVHYEFGRRVRELNLPGIGQDGVEHSLSSVDDIVRYGLAGTVRTDILLRDDRGNPLAIYDLKTGNAQLTPRRREELRAAARAPDVPVIELRYVARTAIRR